ncbi:hypothetical protein POM88_000750 [Heracleum sosnowskyi]|uniref:Uncharacterized protein n=1 Tax=Heracleum sosnowskyi TaxID=360622 RepID=A0AAD8N4B2_9APIA|nr:hypothetical protein POM88_000750 [Heracleum sosnowskyi]
MIISCAEAEGDDEEQVGADGIKFARDSRSICDGDYKKKPTLGEPKLGVVTFINKKNIKEPHYKKTLKAIVRMRWDYDTAKQKGRARETFLNECIEEFKEYYEYPPECNGDKVKEMEGDAVVRKHLKNNIKSYTNGWKSDGLMRVDEAHAKGDTTSNLRSCAPYYLSESAWNGLVDYWETERFSKMSENGRVNVKKSEINHSSGAKPFDQRYEELEKKNKKPLTILEKFDVSYKKNGQVEEIGKKLKVVVERTMQEGNSQEDNFQEGCYQNVTPSPGSQRKREVELLLEVCPPKKGKVLMFPRHTLPEILGLDGAAKYTTSQSTLSRSPERIPERAYSMIGKVMTEVTNMVEAIEEIEVTRARLDEEVQKLATRAYPNGEDPASKILWEDYIRIAAQMTTPLFERYKKVILEATRSETPINQHEDDYHEDDYHVTLEALENRYPLFP